MAMDQATALQVRAMRLETARIKAATEKERARAAYWRATARKFEADKKRTQERINAAKIIASEDRDITRREDAQRSRQEREDKDLRTELNQTWFDDERRGAPPPP